MDPQIIIASRVAKELRNGDLVNLGIGIPTLVANHVRSDLKVFFQSENGLIGTGPIPEQGLAHPTLTDAGAKRVIVAMQHAAKGKSKIVSKCTLPLTSVRPVDLVVTDMAVIGFPEGRATLLETAPGVSVEQVTAATQAQLAIPASVPGMQL